MTDAELLKFERRFIRASPTQPVWATSVVAFKRSTLALLHAGLLIPADDLDQVLGIGEAFLEGMYPKSRGWEHYVNASKVDLTEYGKL